MKAIENYYKGLSLLMSWIMMCNISLFAQHEDTFHNSNNNEWRTLIVPSLGLTYGLSSLFVPGIKTIDNNIQQSIKFQSRTTALDDYILYIPVVSVYGLDTIGWKAKNNLIDRSIILGMSGIFVAPTVHLIKNGIGRLRPDSSTYNSFPSGHTATSFVAATFMWMEYKENYPLLAHSGFLIATTTGILRMYNNRHWFSDVVMGASIGFLGTMMMYRVYPHLKNWILKKSAVHELNWMICPQMGNQFWGIQFKYHFN